MVLYYIDIYPLVAGQVFIIPVPALTRVAAAEYPVAPAVKDHHMKILYRAGNDGFKLVVAAIAVGCKSVGHYDTCVAGGELDRHGVDISAAFVGSGQPVQTLVPGRDAAGHFTRAPFIDYIRIVFAY